MGDDKQDRIRNRAYEIWESEGRPHGAHERHWQKAAAEIEAEAFSGSGKAAVKAAASGARPKARETKAASAGKPKKADKPAKPRAG